MEPGNVGEGIVRTFPTFFKTRCLRAGRFAAVLGPAGRWPPGTFVRCLVRGLARRCAAVVGLPSTE